VQKEVSGNNPEWLLSLARVYRALLECPLRLGGDRLRLAVLHHGRKTFTLLFAAFGNAGFMLDGFHRVGSVHRVGPALLRVPDLAFWPGGLGPDVARCRPRVRHAGVPPVG